MATKPEQPLRGVNYNEAISWQPSDSTAPTVTSAASPAIPKIPRDVFYPWFTEHKWELISIVCLSTAGLILGGWWYLLLVAVAVLVLKLGLQAILPPCDSVEYQPAEHVMPDSRISQQFQIEQIESELTKARANLAEYELIASYSKRNIAYELNKSGHLLDDALQEICDQTDPTGLSESAKHYKDAKSEIKTSEDKIKRLEEDLRSLQSESYRVSSSVFHTTDMPAATITPARKPAASACSASRPRGSGRHCRLSALPTSSQ
jgi:hypothetical protein